MESLPLTLEQLEQQVNLRYTKSLHDNLLDAGLKEYCTARIIEKMLYNPVLMSEEHIPHAQMPSPFYYVINQNTMQITGVTVGNTTYI